MRDSLTANVAASSTFMKESLAMDANRFDALSRTLAGLTSRRHVIGGVLAAAVALAGVRSTQEVATGKRKKRKKKPLKRNEYGCVPVGKACRGRDNVCCSGICDGEKPDKGEKDLSRCVAHDTGGCQAGQRRTICGGTDVPCTTSLGAPGVCETTTGNAGYCFASGACLTCRNDAECQAIMADPRAACILPCGHGICGTYCLVP